MRHVISCSVSSAPSQTIKDTSTKKGLSLSTTNTSTKKEVESDEPVPNNHKTIARINSCSKHVEFFEESFCEECNKPICVACLNDEHKNHKWKPKNKYIEHIGDSARN